MDAMRLNTGSVRLYDVRGGGGRPCSETIHAAPAAALFSSDGQGQVVVATDRFGVFAGASAGGKTSLRNVGGSSRYTAGEGRSRVSAMAVHPEARAVALAGEDGEIHICRLLCAK